VPVPPVLPSGNVASTAAVADFLLYVDGTLVNFVTSHVCDLKLEIGYSHPARLSFTVYAPQHTLPFGHREFIQLVDESFGGLATPLFEGHIHDIVPGKGANEIKYTAYDPTRRAAAEVTIMNGFHDDASSYPRAVWNSKIDNDDDYAFEIEHDASTAVILSTIMENALPELVPMQAAPPSGQAYVDADLTAFDYVSQEKVVFESETIRGGIDRLLGLYPNYRILFQPGEGVGGRCWRFRDVISAPQVTLTLNDHSDTQENKVLSLDIGRSMESRATAVKIYGPEKTETGDISTSSGLTKLWNGAYDSGFETGGPGGSPLWVDVSRKWQITDEDKRHMANLLPEGYEITNLKSGVNGSTGENVTTSYTSRFIAFLATWDGGTSWEPIEGASFDKNQGIITTPFHVYKYEEPEIEGEDPNYTLPDTVRLVYPYFIAGLSVRYPSSGYSGTAESVAGAEIEMRRYDESLAVGYERYQISDQATRTGEFEKLAQSIQEARRDIVYTGGVTLQGLCYEWLRLNRRVNITAIDGDGAALTTGWEEIDAILTDVEYDFSDRLTTLTFSSDHMEFTQADPEALKTLLKLDAMAEPQPTWVVIEYDYGHGRKARFVVQSMNEDRYGGDASAEDTASKYDPNSPNYQPPA